jgi:acetoin utilization deacetylase AcuC-like enzyme
MKVGLVYGPVYLEHDTGGHIENKQRLVEVMALLESSGVAAQLVKVTPRLATGEEVGAVHTLHHIQHVEGVARSGGGWLDGDTVASPKSYQVALYAAGGALSGLEAVMAGQVDAAFALVRPPGHHATPGQAMGFCLFNNIAIAARHALGHYGLERVLIVDFDVHHGNGTQDIFNEDPQVLYFSTHQYPLYPGTGFYDEVGQDEGIGTKVNMPLPPGCGDDEYQRAFEEVLVPVARRFKPQVIMVSAGYDAHWADPISLMQVSVSGFASMVATIKGLAQELCSGRLLLCLEGGYHLQALPYSVKATFEVLLGGRASPDPLGKPPSGGRRPDIGALLAAVKMVHRLV